MIWTNQGIKFYVYWRVGVGEAWSATAQWAFPLASAPLRSGQVQGFVGHCGTAIFRSPVVRPGAAGLLTGVEYSRVRDSTWNVPYPLVSTQLGVVLVDVQGNYPTMLE